MDEGRPFVLDNEHVYILNEDPLGGKSKATYYGCEECDRAYSVVFLLEDEGKVTCPHCEPHGWSRVHVNAPQRSRLSA